MKNDDYNNSKITVRKIILSSQLNKAKEAIIYVEILKRTVDSSLKEIKEYKRISTKVTVSPQNWSKSKSEVLSKDSDYQNKNFKVNTIYNKILTYTTNLENESYRQVTENEFEQLKGLFAPAKGRKGLIEYLEEYIEIRKNDGSALGTYKEFTTVKNRIKSFETYINKKLYFEDINLTFSDNFNLWMIKEQKYNTGTIEKTFTILKTFLAHYFKRRKELNIQLDDTFNDKDFKKGKKSVNEAHPITKKHFKILLDYDFGSDKVMTKTKDRFIIQCTTGLRYSDLFSIKPEMIVNDCIKIQPSKTRNKKDNTIYIDLNPVSKEYLKKYDFDTSKLQITNQKYNEQLKTMFESLGIDDIYTTHDARDTFISYSIQAGVDIPTILSWTGQESYDIMKRYIKLTNEHKAKQMKKVF